jgi:hypothetical protein
MNGRAGGKRDPSSPKSILVSVEARMGELDLRITHLERSAPIAPAYSATT